MFFGSPNRKLSTARKVISLLVLGCVLFASAPLPIGLKVVQRGAGPPFPCMDCACGCATAEQCWTACCCFTPAERQRWADEHDVTPPSYAVLSAPSLDNASQHNASLDNSLLSRLQRDSELSGSPTVACGSPLCSQQRKGTCSSCAPHVCHDCEAAGEVGSSADTSRADAGDTPSAAESNAVTVISVVALRCRGASSEFTLLPWAIVESKTINFTSPEAIAARYLVCSETADSVAKTPATPPPKC